MTDKRSKVAGYHRHLIRSIRLPCMPSEHVGNKVDPNTSKRQTSVIRVCGMRSGERQRECSFLREFLDQLTRTISELQVLSDLRCRIAQSQSIDESISTQTRIEPVYPLTCVKHKDRYWFWKSLSSTALKATFCTCNGNLLSRAQRSSGSRWIRSSDHD